MIWVVTLAGLAAGLTTGCDAVKREAAELERRMARERDAGPQLEAEDVFDDPPPTSEAPGLRPGRYRLRAVGATVTRRNAAGQAWDLVGGAGPDPALAVAIDGKRVASCPTSTDATRLIVAGDSAAASGRSAGLDTIAPAATTPASRPAHPGRACATSCATTVTAAATATIASPRSTWAPPIARASRVSAPTIGTRRSIAAGAVAWVVAASAAAAPSAVASGTR